MGLRPVLLEADEGEVRAGLRRDFERLCEARGFYGFSPEIRHHLSKMRCGQIASNLGNDSELSDPQVFGLALGGDAAGA